MNQVKVTERVQKQLFELQDLQYRDFQAKLLPTIEKETVIGVRMPVLRKFAKGYGKTEEAKEFLKILPHQYYDENNLHGLLIEQIKDYDRCLAELERFLPYIDNWATCDMLAVKVMKNHLDTFIEEVCHWMKSDRTYTIRFGIGMLMRYYLGDEFRIEYPRNGILQPRSQSSMIRYSHLLKNANLMCGHTISPFKKLLKVIGLLQNRKYI